jgi:hypothetical protein
MTDWNKVLGIYVIVQLVLIVVYGTFRRYPSLNLRP